MAELSAQDQEVVLPALKELLADSSVDSWDKVKTELVSKFSVNQEIVQKLSEDVTKASSGDMLAAVKTLAVTWDQAQEEKKQAVVTAPSQDVDVVPDMELPDEQEVVEAIVAEVEAVVKQALSAAEDLADFPELAQWIKEEVEAELTRLAGLDI